jgi:hypothetical protein
MRTGCRARLQRVGGQQLGHHLQPRHVADLHSGVPSATVPRWSAARFSTGPPPASAARSRAGRRRRAAHHAERGARLLQVVAATCAARFGGSSSFCAACTTGGRRRAWWARRSPAAPAARCAAARRAPAPAPRGALDALAGARCTRPAPSTRGLLARLRSSSSGDSTGAARHHVAGLTASPSRSAMRAAARPAAPTRRSGRPAACARPRRRGLEAALAAVASSTSSGRGAKAQASRPPRPDAPAASQVIQVLRVHVVTPSSSAPPPCPAGRCAGAPPARWPRRPATTPARPGIGARLDHHRKVELVAGQQPASRCTSAQPSSMPSGSATRDHQRQLAQQQRRHLGAREAQHAQAGQLPGALGQRDARVVVDHADRDDHREGVSTVLMMRMLRALISCMLRSMLALLKAPATRGRRAWRRAARSRLPRSSASTKPLARSPSPSARLSASRSM